jgi:hypothetical protein
VNEHTNASPEWLGRMNDGLIEQAERDEQRALLVNLRDAILTRAAVALYVAELGQERPSRPMLWESEQSVIGAYKRIQEAMAER